MGDVKSVDCIKHFIEPSYAIFRYYIACACLACGVCVVHVFIPHVCVCVCVQMEEMEKRWREAQEEVRAREVTIAEVEKKDMELAQRLKQSQASYEALRTDKTSIAKELLQASVS